jgi:SNF family Na+-dependent transporter
MSKEEEKRESWGNHCDFFLSSLGLAVGLGNVWRFPYIAYTNGGGSFLIPYIFMLFLAGFPLLFVEQSIGQYAKVGANKVRI